MEITGKRIHELNGYTDVAGLYIAADKQDEAEAVKIPTSGFLYNYAEVSVTSEELLSIGDEPKMLLPSPGSGKYYRINEILFEFTYNTIQYQLGIDEFLMILGLDIIGSCGIKSGLINNPFNQVACYSPITIDPITAYGIDFSVSSVQKMNQQVQLTTFGRSNPQFGNGTMLVKIWYRIETFGSNV